MRAYIRGALYSGQDINAEEVAIRFCVDGRKVFAYCDKFATMNGRYFQKLHNTPGIDYTPVGHYAGVLRLPAADGAKNPFLTEDGQLKSGIVQLTRPIPRHKDRPTPKQDGEIAHTLVE